MPLISGDRYFRDLIGGQKIIVTFEQQLISGGGGGEGRGAFRNSTVCRYDIACFVRYLPSCLQKQISGFQ